MDDHHNKLDEIMTPGIRAMMMRAMEEDQCPICFFSLLITVGVSGLKQSCRKEDFVRLTSIALKIGEDRDTNMPKNMRMH